MPTSQPSKPTIMGLYGISSCGKSYLLNKLKAQLAHNTFAFYNGSTLINSVVPGGLLKFKKASLAQQTAYHKLALSKAVNDCQKAGKAGVVTGHYMFWPLAGFQNRIGTVKDWETYTHIVYLNVDADIVARRRKDDDIRVREEMPAEHLRQWRDTELEELRALCCKHGILFTTITEDASTTPGNSSLERLAALLTDFRNYDEATNTDAVMYALDTALENRAQLEMVLVLDADKTLAPQDIGLMFWQEVSPASSECPLSAILKTQGYTYGSFRQAMLLYEERADEFEDMCDKVASKVEMYPEMIELLNRVATASHAAALVVTCGLRRVWKQVLKRYGLSHVQIVGGGRLADGYVVTGLVKGDVVNKLHDKKLRVVAFGDSPLDIEMFHKADKAYVVVGDKAARSTSMELVLSEAIHEKNLSALQATLPHTAGHRLDLDTFPRANFDNAELGFIFRRPSSDRFVHAAEKNSAKVLMTPTRDAANRSYVLRKAHEHVGYYLTMEYLSEIIGLEEIEIQHVQYKPTDGYRFRQEKRTLIIPMMRGGEPLAFGVSKAMPGADFAHAKKFSDVDSKNLEGKRTSILVDLVVNTGGSIVDFVQPLREKYPHVRIVVVAGVVQANAVAIQIDSEADNRFAELLRDD
jgi:uracil phosphoribosyltransferase/phosphoserine phosphatase